MSRDPGFVAAQTGAAPVRAPATQTAHPPPRVLRARGLVTAMPAPPSPQPTGRL